MTVGEAMERAEELRPGSRVAARTRQRWLCEVDGMLREKFFRPSSADSREGVGADIAWDVRGGILFKIHILRSPHWRY